MYQVRIDHEKNRLYLTIGSIKDEAEMQEINATILSECKKLKKGFTCLTDLRKYDPNHGFYDIYIREVQEALIKSGISKVVRVRRPLGTIAQYQFDNISYELGYHAPHVTTIEEGEKILDEESM